MQINITDEQERRIAARAAEAGLSTTQVIRRLLDEGLRIDDGAGSRRRAICATAGALPDADDWEAWLADVRGGTAAEQIGR
jgi:hypothetical protein